MNFCPKYHSLPRSRLVILSNRILKLFLSPMLFPRTPHVQYDLLHLLRPLNTKYEGWNFNSGNYLFTTDKK